MQGVPVRYFIGVEQLDYLLGSSISGLSAPVLLTTTLLLSGVVAGVLSPLFAGASVAGVSVFEG